MLGRTVHDPDGVEGAAGSTAGLGLLDVETVMTGDKSLTRVEAIHAVTGTVMQGYEIHIGRTEGGDRERPFAHVAGVAEGAVSADGRVQGSYLHGMFAEDGFRRAFLEGFGVTSGPLSYGQVVEDTLDLLAAHMERHLDIDGMLALAR